jgi:cytochrome oxidase Cu insertion factor (SCO1/SenC/PrrC family)
MKKSGFTIFALYLLVLILFASISQPALAGGKPDKAPPALKVGDEAPDFKLQYFDGKGLKDVSLADYRGKKNVVLAFYVFAFTGG